MKIYIGADHRGFALKEALKKFLAQQAHEVVDVGNAIYNAGDDYPDYARAVAEKVVTDADSRGIVICGSGAGVAITANKVRGVRAATIADPRQARMARADEDINVLALAADFMDKQRAEEIAEAFLATEFSGAERHVRRLAKIE